MIASLANKTGSLVLSEGSVSFISPFGTFDLEGEEFALLLVEGGEKKRRASSEFILEEVTSTAKEINLRYAFGELRVMVTYAAERERFVKTLRLASPVPFRVDDLVLEGRHARESVDLTRGGEGMPFFVNDFLYLGIEFPVADNQVEGDAFRMLEHPYATVNSYSSLSVVYRIKEGGKSLEETFRDDIASRAIRKNDTPFSLVYGNWGLYDNMNPGDPVLEESLALRSVEDLKEFEKATGAKFSAYIMDAFWFKKGTHYAEFDRKALPNGFVNLKKELAEDALDLGLWFDLCFREDYPHGLDAFDSGHGNGCLCFGEEAVYSLFRSSILQKVKEESIKAIKFDFAFFDCENPHHDHAQGTTASKEKAVKNFLSLVRDLRALEPNIVLYCYNGFTRDLESIASIFMHEEPIVSPYWSAFVDFVYCGDPRPAEIPADSMGFSLSCYTDAMIASFHDSYFPLASIDDHGTMVGNTGTIYYLGKECFRLGVLLGLLRGGKKLHLYGDLSLLDKSDRDYFRFLHEIAMDMDEKKMAFSLAFGDTRLGEVYGYIARNENEGYAVLVNPTGTIASPLFAPIDGKGKNIRLETLIVDGRIGRKAKTIREQTTIDLGKEGYALLRFKIAPAENKAKQVLLRPGDKVECKGKKGKDVLVLRFHRNDKPLRTPSGIPACVEIEGAMKPEKTYWSGLSWAKLPFKDANAITITNRGDEDILVTISTERKA
ncbi:MAG: hypothetical protein ACI4UT_04500 [Candidatus Enteromonas sp.]